MKYIGSKQKLLPHILAIADSLGAKKIFDGFSGSTRVSQALSRSGRSVIANDISVFSKIFGQCYLLNSKQARHYVEVITHLNNLKGYDGWFTENYGGDDFNGSAIQPDGKKKLWQRHNTQKLDAIRDEIERVANDEIEKSVLLTSLILAMDKVDSSLGHQVSYLKDWSPRSYQRVKLEVPLLNPSDQKNAVLQGDSLEISPTVESDLSYFDPPYGSSNEKMPPSRVRYASYYHVWTTICLNDRPKLVGVANRREDCSDVLAGSIFEEYRQGKTGRFIVIEALEKLIREARSEYVVLSYSSQGRATTNQILELINDSKYSVELLEIDYKRNIMGSMKWTDVWTRDGAEKLQELIFVISKSKEKICLERKFEIPAQSSLSFA